MRRSFFRTLAATLAVTAAGPAWAGTSASLSSDGSDSVDLGETADLQYTLTVNGTAGGTGGTVQVTGTFPPSAVLDTVKAAPVLWLGLRKYWGWASNEIRRYMVGQDTQDMWTSYTSRYLTTSSEYPCGVYGMAKDPTTGTIWLMLGRNSTTSCNRTTNRWLATYDPNTNVATWVAQVPTVMNSIAFTEDGRLAALKANSGGGRGSLYELDKTTGAATFRLRADRIQNYSDYGATIFRDHDGDIVIVSQCHLTRVNPSDWSERGYAYVGGLCGYHRAADAGRVGQFYDFDGGSIREVSLEAGAYVPSLIGPYTGLGVSTTRGIVYDGEIAEQVACSIVGNAFSCTVPELDVGQTVAIVLRGTITVPEEALPRTEEASVRVVAPGYDNTFTESFTVLGDDVAVSASPVAANYQVSDSFTYQVDVETVGGYDSQPFFLDIALDPTVRVTSIGGGSGCALARTGVRCDYTGGLAAYDSDTITIWVDAEAEGRADLRATVSYLAGTDLNPSNDRALSRVVIGDANDLVVRGGLVELAAAPAVELGASFDVTYTVVNNGPGETTTTARLSLADFDLDEASTDIGECAEDTEADALVCDLGVFPIGTTATIAVSLTPTRFGALSAALVASSTFIDVNPDDNSYGVRVDVAPSPLVLSLDDARGRNPAGRPVVAHLVVTHDGTTDQELALVEVTGTAKFLHDGGVFAGDLAVFRDLDGNGSIEEGDPNVGSARVSVEGGAFAVTFAEPVSVASGEATHLLFIAAADLGRAQVATTASADDASIDPRILLGLIPAVAAGFLALRRRRATWALLAVLAFGAPACDALDDLLNVPSVRVTIEGGKAVLADQPQVRVPVSGGPLQSPTVLIGR